MLLVVDKRYLKPSENGLSFQFPVVRHLKSHDKLVSAVDYKDQPAKLTQREAEFCKLLIDMASQLSTRVLPVVFDTEGGKLILDKGCIKFAEHRGLIRTLQNDSSGLVSSIELNFDV